ncbi:hypothetical protein Glo7428_2303 [Gloeocapsa sp. PCC 7428]|nr:hypothetical protein Glo7428_2303 [Gloeocapsa sp. PCC 7428]
MYANFWSIFLTVSLLIESIPSLVIIALALRTNKKKSQLHKEAY